MTIWVLPPKAGSKAKLGAIAMGGVPVEGGTATSGAAVGGGAGVGFEDPGIGGSAGAGVADGNGCACAETTWHGSTNAMINSLLNRARIGDLPPLSTDERHVRSTPSSA